MPFGLVICQARLEHKHDFFLYRGTFDGNLKYEDKNPSCKVRPKRNSIGIFMRKRYYFEMYNIGKNKM